MRRRRRRVGKLFFLWTKLFGRGVFFSWRVEKLTLSGKQINKQRRAREGSAEHQSEPKRASGAERCQGHRGSSSEPPENDARGTATRSLIPSFMSTVNTKEFRKHNTRTSHRLLAAKPAAPLPLSLWRDIARLAWATSDFYLIPSTSQLQRHEYTLQSGQRGKHFVLTLSLQMQSLWTTPVT